VDVLALVLCEGLRLASLGVILGTAAALPVFHSLRALLFDVSPVDPSTLAVTMIVLMGSALLATYAPARRAARVDPVVALRAE
jgi:ABC-type lipoprotein release transport system permease subunit